ncbi:MAG TPA: lysophospholipase [Bacillota bacterium]|nr:lysophospholipase [Bacillota bacterium]
MSPSNGHDPVLRHFPAEVPKCTLLVVPGYADHAGRYTHVGDYFSIRGIDVYALDLTGHGKAPGRRGHIDSFAQYRQDVLSALKHVTGPEAAPVFLLGHSLGGLIVSSTLLHHKLPLAGVLLSSPFLGLGMPVSPVKATLAMALSKAMPTFAMPNNIPANHLSRDSTVGEAYLADHLVFRTATARWFTETLGAMAEVKERVGEISAPMAIFQAGDERIANKAAVVDFFGRLSGPEKTYTEYPGYYHEILNEIGKEQVMLDMALWIEGKIAD